METKRIDIRKLEPAARQQLRRTVIGRHKRGHKQSVIAQELGLRRPTGSGWIAKVKAGRGVKEARRGRPLGDGRKLTPAQEEWIRPDLVDKTPEHRKRRFALWNAQAARALIKAHFLIDLPVRSVRNDLKRWGFTSQRPLQRVFEQKLQAVRTWREPDSPVTAARAKRQGAEIHWGDETAVSSVEHYPRGFAPRGKTPVLGLSPSKRERIKLISAITHRGALRFMRYRNTRTAEGLIQLLERLIREAGRKVFLILDNLRVPPSRKVWDWLADELDHIKLFFLPRYWPELNPDEYLNADLKARRNAAEPVREGAHLKPKVVSHLRSIQKQPARVRSYVRANSIRYAA